MVLNHSPESCLHQVWKSKPALCGFCDSHKNFAKSGVLLHDESRWSTLFSHVLWNGHTTHVAHVALDMQVEHLWTSMNIYELPCSFYAVDTSGSELSSRQVEAHPHRPALKPGTMRSCNGRSVVFRMRVENPNPTKQKWSSQIKSDQVSTQCNSLHAVPNCTLFFMSSTNALSANYISDFMSLK